MNAPTIAIVPLSPAASTSLLEKMSHAVGHDLGPNNHRNDYTTEPGDSLMRAGHALGLLSLQCGTLGVPYERFVVNDAGKEVLRSYYRALHQAKGQKPLRAFYVETADPVTRAYNQSRCAYGELEGSFVLAETASKARAHVWYQCDCACAWKDLRVTRAYAIDHRVADWTDSRAETGAFSILHPGRLVTGPDHGKTLYAEYLERLASGAAE